MKADIRGLSSIPEEDLTQEEQIALDVAQDEQSAELESYNNDMEILMAALSNSPNPPTYDDIESWRDQYGNIHVSSVMNEDDVYIWRTLKRQEYKQMSRDNQLAEAMRAEEFIVRKCLLFPKGTSSFIASSNAGAISSLYTQIMYKSGFVPEQTLLRNIKEI